MPSTVIKTLKVEELTKYGFKADGRYINWSKNLKDTEKVPVVPGRTFQFELYISDSSKEYVNKVVNMVQTADVPAPKKQPKVATASVSEAMTRSDWDAKDRRISRQGVIQAAVQAVASQSTLEDLFTNAETLANQMLEFVGK